MSPTDTFKLPKNRVAWFTSKGGGQTGVHPENIKYLLAKVLHTKCGLVIPLDEKNWEAHQQSLVNSCL